MISLEHRQHLVELINEAVDSGARVAQACSTVNIHDTTYRRWHDTGTVKADARPLAVRSEPRNKLSQQEREQVLLTCHLPEFQSLPPGQIVPNLADKGIYLASEATYYRILREASEQHDRGRANAPHKRAKPEAYEATGPNQYWAWDVTYLRSPTRGLFYYLYMISDVFSRKIVGWEVHVRECGELASELVTKAVIGEGYPDSLDILHADNGSIQKSSTLRVTLEKLGVEPTYSRPRVSNDNAYPEALFRTVKYRPNFPFDGFSSLDNARQWVLQFVTWYNSEHKHSGINFVTPMQRHKGEDTAILAKRHELYLQSRAKNPERWSGGTRNWSRASTVVLHPDKNITKTAVVNLEKAA